MHKIRFHKNVSRRCLNRNTKHNEAWPPHFDVLGKCIFTTTRWFETFFLRQKVEIKDVIIPNKGRPSQNTTEKAKSGRMPKSLEQAAGFEFLSTLLNKRTREGEYIVDT